MGEDVNSPLFTMKKVIEAKKFREENSGHREVYQYYKRGDVGGLEEHKGGIKVTGKESERKVFFAL